MQCREFDVIYSHVKYATDSISNYIITQSAQLDI